MHIYKVILKLDGAIVHEASEMLSGEELERYDHANREFATAYARDEVEQLLELGWELAPRRYHS